MMARKISNYHGLGILPNNNYERSMHDGFAQRLKESLDRAGMGDYTQAELALRLGLSTPFTNHLLNGKRLPSMETALKLCEMLKVSLDWLMLGQGKPDGNFNLEELWMSYSEEDRVKFLADLALKRQI